MTHSAEDVLSTKPHLILHIGTEKTGTKSIQEFLRINTNLLLETGVFIPSYLGRANHSLLPAVMYKDERHDDISDWLKLSSPMVRLKKRKEVIDLLRKSAALYPNHTFIISSEYLQSRLTDNAELAILKEQLYNIYDKVTILLYIRKPIETAISSWSTGVKCGTTDTCLRPPSDPYIHNLCMHKETVERWGYFFGNNNIRVRVFDNDFFYRGNLIEDFANACGIGLSPKFSTPCIINKKLGHTPLIVLANLNKIFGSRFPIGRARTILINRLARYYQNYPSYAPSRQEAQLYRDYYRESNSWIKKMYFDESTNLWDDADL